MEYRTSSTIYKKLSNARSFNDKSGYDGVFSAQSKHGVPVFSARFEDYREIFGASRVSSIPILDVPELDDRKLPVDVRSSKLEYSKIFGGFDELNFAMPYDELLAESKKTKSFHEETRTSPGRRSPTAKKISQVGKENISSTHEPSSQPFDRMENSSVSFQKINQGSENSTKETIHIAPPHPVPGFTRVVDEHPPVQMCSADRPTSEELNDICLKNIENKVVNMTEVSISSDNEQTFRTTKSTECHNGTGWYRSDSIDTLLNTSEGDRWAQCPETSPKCYVVPNFGISDGLLEKSAGFSSKGTEHSDDADMLSSPPYFEEVDVNSVAAVSVAALKKAIDAAEARIKIAKETMERRKAGRQKPKKCRASRSLNSEEKSSVRTLNNSSTCQEDSYGEIYKKTDVTAQASFEKSREQSCIREYPGHPKVTRENLYVVETNDLEIKSVIDDCKEKEAEELRAAKQLHDSHSLGKEKVEELESEMEEYSESNEYYADECKLKTDHGSNETLEKSGECGDSMVVVNEANEREESGAKLSVVKGILLSKLISMLGVAGQEESVIRSDLTQNVQETEMRAEEAFTEHEKYMKLPEMLQEIEYEDEKLAIRKTVENNNREDNVEAYVWVEEELRGISLQAENERETRIDTIDKDAKLKLEKSNEVEENVNWIDISRNGEETGELEGSKILKENGQSDEMIECISFPLYNDDNGHIIIKQKKIDECAEYDESMMKANPDYPYIENKIELVDGLCKQDKFDNLLKHQEAINFAIERMEVVIDQPKFEDSDYSIKLAKTSFQAINYEFEVINTDDMADKAPSLLASMAVDVPKLNEITIKMEDTDASPISDQNGIEFGRIGIKLEINQYDTLVNGSSNLGISANAEGLAPEPIEIERRVQNIEVPTNEESIIDDSNSDEILNNIEVFPAPRILEDDRKFSGVAEETFTSTATGTEGDAENSQATMRSEDSGTKSVLEEEMRLESDGNSIGADNQPDTIEINTASEIFHEIKTSQSPIEKEKIHQSVATDDEMEASDSADEEVEHTFNWEILEEVNHLDIFSKEEKIDHGINTSQKVSDNENPMLEEIETNIKIQREAEVESEIDNQNSAQGEEAQELDETLTNKSDLENEESHQATLLMEEKAANEKLGRDAELKRLQQRKIDEAKEKEKERDRERMAVERVIREARERAFAEARDRAAAERATADTRRRVMAETRERSVKISAEANVKPTAEKASMKAKLKAQRAAVERATNEARERALEKAMSEKTISEARNLADKIVAEKLSGFAGDGKVKKSFSFNDCQPKVPCPSSSFRHANSFNLGGHDSSEKDDGSSGESVQRCKARLERHQRTVERVAKVLAEKNIRDLLAQKEQEERNRVAEALDVEVKRWSNGKEGNLRALLSTLQYILGPDSGWQSIPLTDIITTAAVKKAYRRATLSVHPDKLQQRGASIQQKYICEKVFDLLKAAWNRFNVEER